MDIKQKLEIELTAHVDTKPFARTLFADMCKKIKSLEIGGFGTRGSGSVGVSNVKIQKPKELMVSPVDLAEEDIRIVNVIDIKNMLNTAGFEEPFASVCELTDWLYENLPNVTGPRILAPFILAELDPLLAKICACMPKYARDFIGLRVSGVGDAFIALNDPNFDFFVKVQTPVRMYFPDGKYRASWGITRFTYGHGSDYQSALLNAYKQIKRLRQEKQV